MRSLLDWLFPPRQHELIGVTFASLGFGAAATEEYATCVGRGCGVRFRVRPGEPLVCLTCSRPDSKLIVKPERRKLLSVA